MPFDPFFTSGVKDEQRERKFKSQAVAKAGQFKRQIMFLNKAKRRKALDHAACSPNDSQCHKLKSKGRMLLAGGQKHPSLTGFKTPKRKWDKKLQ